jgi:2-methylaconitate cis-trans-isomerase PrpF
LTAARATGAKITIDWSGVIGGITGQAPADRQYARQHRGRRQSIRSVDIVDAGNVVVFIRAESLGLSGDETPDWIRQQCWLMKK